MPARSKPAVPSRRRSSQADALRWWREARFGMFIHWGLYALPAGTWKGREMPHIGEWIQSYFRIPNAEYEQLADTFNPVRFDAGEWVRVAKQAGMRYIVITAKHHDGFAMYRSANDRYDIVDASPYNRDPLKDLARACRRAGLKFCVYYSHNLDWHERDAGGTGIDGPDNGGMSWGNDWDFPDAGSKRLGRYIEKKVKPQLRELLTNYGPIGLVWFDCPLEMPARYSRDLRAFVKKLQPGCLVNGRIGNGQGDYETMGDNQIPAGPVRVPMEVPVTLNDTWGFKKQDRNWKPADQLLDRLIDLASKGANLLLNVGPTASGIIPSASAGRLKTIGQWLAENGEAIYAADPSPYSQAFRWGRMTRRRRRLYLIFSTWPGSRFELYGLRSRVRLARLLSDPEQRYAVRQSQGGACDVHRLEVDLPRRQPAKPFPVVVLELADDLEVDASLCQQPDGTVTLPAHLAELHSPRKGPRIRVGDSGVVEDWRSIRHRVSWSFNLLEAGTYDVSVYTKVVSGLPGEAWRGGHRVKLVAGDTTRERRLRADDRVITPATQYHAEAGTHFGEVHFAGAGPQELALRAATISKRVPWGLTVSKVTLTPATERTRALSKV